MHEYTVDLTISADDFDDGEVSVLLALAPSTLFRKGEPRSAGSKVRRERSTWSFHCDPPGGGAWATLEEGLEALLETFEPRKDALKQLSERFAVEAYCGYFGASFGTGPTVSPSTLQRLSSLGLSLTIKVYGSCEAADR
jgi:hypothetical protein